MMASGTWMMAGAPLEAISVLEFWNEAGPSRWFSHDDDFDRRFHDRFMDHHLAAAARRLDGWAEEVSSALALVILLDQFPRNAFRHTAHMFATDPLARFFAADALARGFPTQVDSSLERFFYLPFMHSEALADQERSVTLFRELGEVKYAEEHFDIIRRFGRFPHRNRALGRASTQEEQAFLDGGGFSG